MPVVLNKPGIQDAQQGAAGGTKTDKSNETNRLPVLTTSTVVAQNKSECHATTMGDRIGQKSSFGLCYHTFD
jgi:hypothetical protein